MPAANVTIPLPSEFEPSRAILQSPAQRVGLLVPGASLSHQQVAFAEGVIELAKQGRLSGGHST
jgi:hypothetical protein